MSCLGVEEGHMALVNITGMLSFVENGSCQRTNIEQTTQDSVTIIHFRAISCISIYTIPTTTNLLRSPSLYKVQACNLFESCALVQVAL